MNQPVLPFIEMPVSRRNRLLETLTRGPWTTTQLADILGAPVPSVRRLLHSLKAQGLPIYKTGARRWGIQWAPAAPLTTGN